MSLGDWIKNAFLPPAEPDFWQTAALIMRERAAENQRKLRRSAKVASATRVLRKKKRGPRRGYQ